MRLIDILKGCFSQGIEYHDAVNLCMAIYSGACCRIISNEELTMSHISDIFAELAREGLVKNYSKYKSVIYGANYHSICDKGHWIEIQASMLKLSCEYEQETVDVLNAKISRFVSSRSLR